MKKRLFQTQLKKLLKILMMEERKKILIMIPNNAKNHLKI